MAGPEFPIRVSAEDRTQIVEGDQQLYDGMEGFTESHRKAYRTGLKPDPNKTSLWSGGPLADEIT